MKGARNGVTILEVMVTLAILGLLVSILLPAVQLSRSTARKMQCVNHLRQFGLAFHQHSDVHGHFPTEQDTFVELLPYLDQPNVYKDFQARKIKPPFNVRWISCPQDPYENPDYALASYLINDGTKLRVTRYSTGLNGFRTGKFRNPTRPGDVTDGLSNTAAMSERLLAPSGWTEDEMRATKGRYLWYTERRFAEVGQEEQAIEQCRNHRTTPWPQHTSVNGGAAFFNGAVGYDHMLPPNHEGCNNGPEDFDLSSDHALVAPTSLHRGGVNVLFGDGSVHFIADQIDMTVWRAVGTRAGQETAEFPF